MIRVYKGRPVNVDNSHEPLFCFGVTEIRSTPLSGEDKRGGGRGGPKPRGEAGPGEEDEEDPEKGGEEEAQGGGRD